MEITTQCHCGTYYYYLGNVIIDGDSITFDPPEPPECPNSDLH